MIKEDNSIQFRGPRRGRENQEEEKKEENKEPKKIEVTAWYTLDIPVSNGSGVYWGLPGLILEINEGRIKKIKNKLVIMPND